MGRRFRGSTLRIILRILQGGYGQVANTQTANEEVRLPDATSRNSSENVYSGEMLRATSSSNAPLEIIATVKGPAIYLDNHSFINLERNAVLRRRFTAVLQHGADLLFSIANAIEATRAEGESSQSAKSFLNEIGAHWFPLEMLPNIAIAREQGGKVVPDSCIAEDFLKAFMNLHRSGSGEILILSDDFFRLGVLIDDWIKPHRESLASSLRKNDARLIESIIQLRRDCQRHPDSLDRAFPAIPFSASAPVTFTYVNLMRQLILNKGHNLKKGDGIDFCHAVMGAACASVMTLDKHWKPYMEMLPQPNQLARVYGASELESLIRDVETFLQHANPMMPTGTINRSHVEAPRMERDSKAP